MERDLACVAFKNDSEFYVSERQCCIEADTNKECNNCQISRDIALLILLYLPLSYTLTLYGVSTKILKGNLTDLT